MVGYTHHYFVSILAQAFKDQQLYSMDFLVHQNPQWKAPERSLRENKENIVPLSTFQCRLRPQPRLPFVTEEMRQKAWELLTLPRCQRLFYGFLLGHYAGYNAGGAMARCNLGRPDIYITLYSTESDNIIHTSSHPERKVFYTDLGEAPVAMTPQ